jgi:peptidoglycan/LPS O-acetylase OafA/YrhL
MMNGTFGYEYHGGAAVTLFFVVSGYIMTVAYLDRVNDGGGWDLLFVLRRLARLIPVHYFCLVWGFILIMVDPALPEDWKAGSLFTLPWEATLTGAWGFQGHNLGHINGINWTMSTMFFHYIVFGLVCRNSVAPFVSDERRYTGRIIFTALVSVFLPYCLYRFPVWLGGDENDPAMGHFYFGARSNPLVRLPTYLVGMQLGAATIQNKRHPIPFNWAVLADVLSVVVLLGYVAFTFLAEYTWGVEDRSIDLTLRAVVEFFSTPLFALWFRALSETDQSFSYKILTLKPCKLVGEWSFCLYLSQFLVWGTTHLVLGVGGVTMMSAMGRHDKAHLPEWTRHLMVLELILVSGVMFKLIEEPSRKYLTKRIDASWKTKTAPQDNSATQNDAAVTERVPSKASSAPTAATTVGSGGTTPVPEAVDLEASNAAGGGPFGNATDLPICGVCGATSKFPGAKFCQKCGAAY